MLHTFLHIDTCLCHLQKILLSLSLATPPTPSELGTFINKKDKVSNGAPLLADSPPGYTASKIHKYMQAETAKGT